MHADIGELGAGVIPPSGQAAQVRFAVEVPSMTTYWLVLQFAQSMHIVATFGADVNVPLGQGAQTGCTLPCISMKYPARHWQVGLCWLLPGSIWTWVVALQPVWGVHMAPPGVGLKEPSGQFVHVVAPAVEMVPAAQLAQLAAFIAVLKVPGAHDAQTRLLVEVGAAITYSPGSQTSSGVQTRSLVAVPGIVSYCAGEHTVHAVHIVPLAVSLVVQPVVQRVHVRSTVVEGVVAEKSPALHVLQATQRVLGA